MASSLQANAVKALFQNSSDETKLEVVSELCKTIPTAVFLEHSIVKNHIKNAVCMIVAEEALENETRGASPEGSAAIMEYLFRTSDWAFDHYAAFLDRNYVQDLLLYVRPWEWKWCHPDKIVLSEDQKENDWVEFDFQADIMNESVPSNNVQRMIGPWEFPYMWYEF